MKEGIFNKKGEGHRRRGVGHEHPPAASKQATKNNSRIYLETTAPEALRPGRPVASPSGTGLRHRPQSFAPPPLPPPAAATTTSYGARSIASP